MFKMFAQAFSALTVLFAAFEKFANSVNHLGGWAEQTSAAFADEAAQQRAIKAANAAKEMKLLSK